MALLRAATLLWVGASTLALIACGSDSKKSGEQCQNGICGSVGGTGASSTSGGTNASGGTFASGGSTAGGSNAAGGTVASGGAAGSGTGGNGTCVEKWLCTPWQSNGSDNAGTRTCTDENACGTTVGKPGEQAQLPALDLNYYKCNIEPIMDRTCSMLGCHGTEEGRALRTYSRGRLRAAGETYVDPDNGCLKIGLMTPSEDCIGSIECRCYSLPHTTLEWQRNYDSARGFALDAAGAPIAAGQEDTSELIAQPIVGGKAHAGIHPLKPNSAEHVKLKEWLAGTTLASCSTNN